METKIGNAWCFLIVILNKYANIPQDGWILQEIEIASIGKKWLYKILFAAFFIPFKFGFPQTLFLAHLSWRLIDELIFLHKYLCTQRFEAIVKSTKGRFQTTKTMCCLNMVFT